jgi:hypothetical protein
VWPCIVTNFFVIKPTRYTNFTNLFLHETLHVSDSSSVHHEEFVDSFRAGPSWSCSKAVYKTVWHIPLLSAQWINSWWWTEELSETCRVSCQNKFVKLVHIVGFIIKKFELINLWTTWSGLWDQLHELNILVFDDFSLNQIARIKFYTGCFRLTKYPAKFLCLYATRVNMSTLTR